MHSSHIQFFNFGDSKNLFGLVASFINFRKCRTIIPLSFLKKFKTVAISFPVVFMDLSMARAKIGCVNYAHFPKSGHICDCLCENPPC